MNHTLTLYSYLRCPFAIRVRMVLNEKALTFETIEEDLKNLSPKLRTLHPEARVPLLIHGAEVIYESSIITEYLNDQFPENDLMPRVAHEKMKVRQWTYWCNELFKPEIDRFKYKKSGLDSNEIQSIQERLGSHVEALESSLKSSDWLVGEKFSLADIHLFPFFRQLTKVTPPLPSINNYPKTHEWLEKITSRPAFKKTMEKI